MNIQRKSLLSGAAQARGCAVVVDVFRAFTCASVMLDLGVAELRLEEDVDKCLCLQSGEGYTAIGEIKGVTVEGFAMGNSPSRIALRGRDYFAGRKVVLRTSAGVRGVFAARNHCEQVWAGSYTTAGALARILKQAVPQEVSIVAMGWGGEGTSPEDEYCALLIHSLLDPALRYDHSAALLKILADESAQKFLRADKDHFPPEDVPWCLQRDLFSFAMRIDEVDGVLRVVKVEPQ
jgi:phosphosulfolactate phosphohydrolase-like enzyme